MTETRVQLIQRLNKHSKNHWTALCYCNCGTFFTAIENNIKKGNTKSCGCLLREVRRTLNVTHGMTDTKIYRVWYTMKKRCTWEKHISYPAYSGRGITYDSHW